MGKGTSIIRYNGLQPCCKLTKIDTILPTTVIQDDTANRRCDLSVSTIHRMFTVYPLVRTLGRLASIDGAINKAQQWLMIKMINIDI